LVLILELPSWSGWDDLHKRATAKFSTISIRQSRSPCKERRTLLADPGIIRNRLKIDSTITNTQLFLKTQEEFGSFDKYIWRFVDGKPKQNALKAHKQVPARTHESDAMSEDLQKRGFRFVGSTICYALMQATGMVNDHAVTCFRYRQVSR
jgi:DNA-3-methyladenine glycosylase I